MITFSTVQNNNYQSRINFRGYTPKYTPKQICSELCGGACCNTGTKMSGTIKKIADKLCAQYKSLPDNLKSIALIKAPIVKWVVNSNNIEVKHVTNLANTYIDAIKRETDPEKISQLTEELNKLNKKLIEITNNNECFLPVTNPEMKNASFEELQYGHFNVCIFKDHENTNLCSIYDGIKDGKGRSIPRPSPCLQFGSFELPCPWLNPEKYGELFEKIKAIYAYQGYKNVSDGNIRWYIANQFNLNSTFYEEIMKPYLRSIGYSI